MNHREPSGSQAATHDPAIPLPLNISLARGGWPSTKRGIHEYVSIWVSIVVGIQAELSS